ncbi:MAG: hypothetical protein IJA02_08815 [Clostridia bacterium]|nr:hypothetical protein [Clostridia bacterium]
MPWMSEADICEMYKSAKDQRAQINILAQLNACKTETIRNILLKNGITPVEPRKVKHHSKQRKLWSVEELLQLQHLINEGKNNKELSERFDRSIGAIRCVRAKLNPEIIANPSENIKIAIEIFKNNGGVLLNETA